VAGSRALRGLSIARAIAMLLTFTRPPVFLQVHLLGLSIEPDLVAALLLEELP